MKWSEKKWNKGFIIFAGYISGVLGNVRWRDKRRGHSVEINRVPFNLSPARRQIGYLNDSKIQGEKRSREKGKSAEHTVRLINV